MHRIIFIIIWDFWCFTKIFFHNKWEDMRLLLLNTVYTSDVDMRVSHSDITWWRVKCQYKAALFPYKASKKWEWSARYFGFVYFTRQRHVTEAKNQSNCITSLKCGPPGFSFLLWFAHLEQNIVNKTSFKYRVDHSHFLIFWCLIGKKCCLIWAFCTSSCDVRLSPPAYHHHVFCLPTF